jgi:hypothetical protein
MFQIFKDIVGIESCKSCKKLQALQLSYPAWGLGLGEFVAKVAKYIYKRPLR